MLVAKDKAFIMAVDTEKNQTLYVLYHDDDSSTVKLNKLWSSYNIVKIVIRHDFEKKEEKEEQEQKQDEQDEKIGIYFIFANDGCTFVNFV
jgi:ribosomal protein S6